MPALNLVDQQKQTYYQKLFLHCLIDTVQGYLLVQQPDLSEI